jgi:hypothetical protein
VIAVTVWVAVPLDSVCVPIDDPPSKNCTVPVGPDDGVTLAVSVIFVPVAGVKFEDVIPVDVLISELPLTSGCG